MNFHKYCLSSNKARAAFLLPTLYYCSDFHLFAAVKRLQSHFDNNLFHCARLACLASWLMSILRCYDDQIAFS